ncbi:N-acetylated-alpha-linked acidic dipeptidase 2-like [Lytechinus variegatus]|uniref:N-acetylated-alpha-linked acidic dipeptidase 2-like n=1 Tax=Lytechinus variegatus TaxID=7654 RepID=UPI001BB22812|nr:N-acetylated-alpha-linked acidic dipeptidase 2-like [Lytechinus variegatus]
MNPRTVQVVVGVTTLCVGIGVGVLIGYFSAPGEGEYTNPETREPDESIADRIMEEISAENIKANLRYYARKPHVAGTPADREGADDIRRAWLDQGLDSAELVSYKVYLQHPPSPDNEELANKVQIVDPANGNVAFQSALREDPFGEEELLQPDIPPPFNAYSATGDVTGDLVYVNYGRVEDYEYILDELDPTINFTGKIVIARHGGTGWYTKATNAYDFGCVALLMYTDPANYGVGPEIGLPYPDGKFLPSTSGQRGSVKKDFGDPLTPGYPSRDFAYRRSVNETDLPKVLIHPVGYGDAEKLIKALAGHSPRESWRGGLNTTYPVGPGFGAPYQGMKTRVVINSVSDQYTIYNTVGFIRGAIEPERYVIIGNHRDAWGLGSIDPTSGTASVLEISRVFGKLKREGWRPRRTLMFCSFGGEEYGLIGSIEWTEEFNRILADRVVTYLNLDMGVVDTFYLRSSATPHLRPIIYEATQKIPDPDPSDTRKTVYDTMVEREPDPDNPELPQVLHIGGGSDYYGFEKRLGVPCIMGYYFYDRKTYNINFYSLYHTSYETVRLMDTFIDPEYKYHQAIARTFAEMARNLAERVVLPFDVEAYSNDLTSMWMNLKNTSQARDIEAHDISLEPLEQAIAEFATTCSQFKERLQSVDTQSTVAVRQVNDQMMSLDKAFLGDLPGETLDRHLLFTGRQTQGRSTEKVPSGTFPTILDVLHEIDDDPDQVGRWNLVAQQVAILTHAVEAGTSVLRDVTSW